MYESIQNFLKNSFLENICKTDVMHQFNESYSSIPLLCFTLKNTIIKFTTSFSSCKDNQCPNFSTFYLIDSFEFTRKKNRDKLHY